MLRWLKQPLASSQPPSQGDTDPLTAIFHYDDYFSPSSISVGKCHEFKLLYSAEGLLLVSPKAPALLTSHAASSCSPHRATNHVPTQSPAREDGAKYPDRCVQSFSLFYSGFSIREREGRAQPAPSLTPSNSQLVSHYLRAQEKPRAEPEEYFHFHQSGFSHANIPIPMGIFAELMERHPNHLPVTSGARQPCWFVLGRMLSAHTGPRPARLQGWISSRSRNSLNHPNWGCFHPLPLEHSAVSVLLVKYLPRSRKDKCLRFDSAVAGKPAAGLNQEPEKKQHRPLGNHITVLQILDIYL